MDYSSICQAYISGTSVLSCADNAGNLYGVYNCGSGTTSPSEVVYNTSGIFVNYPTLFCGNRRGIAPDLVAPGALEFNARVEYGLDNCMQGGRSCFTQISTSSDAGGEAWEHFWMGSAGQSTDLVATQSQCTLQPACNDLQLETEGLPLPQQPPAEGSECTDRFGFPFGVYTGTIVQSYSNNQIPVELTYNSRGMFVTYPTLNCGNRLPIVPSVTSPSSMEWNERIEYGIDRCALGGKSSFTTVSDKEWELFWVSSTGTAPAGVASIYLRQSLCSNLVAEEDNNNNAVGEDGGPAEVDQDEEQVEDEEDFGLVDPDMDDEDGEIVNTNEEEDKNNKNNKDKDEEEDDEDEDEDEEDVDNEEDKEDEKEEDDEEEEGDFDLANAESGVATTPVPTPSTTESSCEDESGVAYGTFDGILSQSDNSLTYGVFVYYDSAGVTVDYPAFTCGNVKPLVPVTSEGSLEWTETLDYGVRTCEGGGQVTLTEVSETQWDFTWVGSGNGNGMVTISGELDFKPLC